MLSAHQYVTALSSCNCHVAAGTGLASRRTFSCTRTLHAASKRRLIELANLTYFYSGVEYIPAYAQDIGQPRVAEPPDASRREIEDAVLLEMSERANFPPLLAQPTIRYC